MSRELALAEFDRLVAGDSEPHRRAVAAVTSVLSQIAVCAYASTGTPARCSISHSDRDDHLREAFELAAADLAALVTILAGARGE